MPKSDTQFKPGNAGGPGRPKNSRNKLSHRFITVLSDDFGEHGVSVIAKLRKEQPAQYCQVIGRLMPKLMELSGPDGTSIDMNWKVEIVDPEGASG